MSRLRYDLITLAALLALTEFAAGGVVPPPEGAYTIVVLPDTQEYSYVPHRHEIFLSQTRWIAENHQEQRIAFVLHVGDVTQHNTPEQWELARRVFDPLDEAGVPYVITLGNHDYGTTNFNVKDSVETPFVAPEFFGQGSPYAEQPTVGGFMEESRTDNSFHLLSAGGMDWLVLALEWQPPPDVVAWAGEVIDRHPDHRAILLTHEFLLNAAFPNPAPRTPVGGSLWIDLLMQRDVPLVFCGHVGGTGRLSTGNRVGRVVHQMLANYQGQTEGGHGFLRLIRVHPHDGVVRVRTYSTFLDESRRSTDEQFDLVLCEDVEAPPFQLPDECQPDCNANGVPDARDIAERTSVDRDRNGYPDECDVSAAMSVSATRGVAPLEVRFEDSSSTTLSGHALSALEWRFPDGTTVMGSEAEFVFERPGPKTVAFHAVDDREMEGTATVDIDVLFPSGDVAPWTSVDLGSVGFPGGSRLRDDGLELFAGRGSLTSDDDASHFVYQRRSAPCDLTVLLEPTTIDGIGTARSGLMVRGSLDPGEPVISWLRSRDEVRLYVREKRGTRARRVASIDVPTSDVWLRVRRFGDAVLAAISTDGVTWQSTPAASIALPDEVFIGMTAIVSRPHATSLSTFREVRLEEAEFTSFLRGDTNDDGLVDISDGIRVLGWLFLGEAEPPCLASGDVNGDAEVDLSDASYLFGFLFLGGPGLHLPYPSCGPGTLGSDFESCATPPESCLP